MADRCTLHKDKLEAFKEWLAKDGWTLQEPKGIYEVLRARKPDRKNPLIIYARADAKMHLSIADKDYGVFKAFISSTKNRQVKRGVR